MKFQRKVKINKSVEICASCGQWGRTADCSKGATWENSHSKSIKIQFPTEHCFLWVQRQNPLWFPQILFLPKNAETQLSQLLLSICMVLVFMNNCFLISQDVCYFFLSQDGHTLSVKCKHTLLWLFHHSSNTQRQQIRSQISISKQLLVSLEIPGSCG